MSVCPCKFPILFVDRRYTGQAISYISIPNEVFEEQKYIENPIFEEIEEDGQKYMSVMWKNPKGASVKTYEVSNHLVFAGCSAQSDGKTLTCKKKDLFIVLHPLSEWNSEHIVHIK
jgi:hypothetical protein